MPSVAFQSRLAISTDIPALNALVDASIRGLGAQDYNPQQVESSMKYLFGIDSQIVEDGTYFVVEAENQIVGCGGWSRRKTPFGGDQAIDIHDDDLRDPATDPAIIRAFFVHPQWARQGIGGLLLDLCENAARQEGYHRFELVATLTGRKLYTVWGYQAQEEFDIRLPDGVALKAIRMEKP